MNESDMLAIQRLLSDFTWHADAGDAERLSRLFVEDAVFLVGGKELRGRAQISEDCKQRFLVAGRKSRHVWSNLRVDPVGTHEARSTVVQLTFEQTAASDKTELRVNDIADELRKDADGNWRFARRTVSRQMALHL